MKIRPLPLISSLLAAGLIPCFGSKAAAQLPDFALVNQSAFGITDLWERHDPALGDLDGDGDLDLLLGTVYGVRFFENTGTASTPEFEWDGDENAPLGLQLPANVNSITIDLVDIDGDGDLDVFTGEDLGFTTFFENTGNPSAPAFERDLNPMPFGIYQMAYYNSPSFVDWDGDGDLDLVMGELSGLLHFYENIGTPTAPDFLGNGEDLYGLSMPEFANDSKIDFADLNGDGNIDAVIGTYYGYTYTFVNTGTPTDPAFTGTGAPAFNSFSSSRNTSSPELADLDGDGDTDLLLGGPGYSLFHENAGDPTAPAFGQVFGENDLQLEVIGKFNSSIASVDIDGDGLQDIAISSDDYYQFTFFSNVGTQNDPSFAYVAVPTGIDYNYLYQETSVEFFDANGDGDIDFLSSSFEVENIIVAAENLGDAQNPSFAFNMPAFANDIKSPSNLVRPSAVDIDGDGDMDLFFGVRESQGLGYANLVFFENTGSSAIPAFERQASNFPLGLLAGESAFDASSAFGDFDLDGDIDAMIGVDGGRVLFAENTGTPTAPAFAPPVDASQFGVPPLDDQALSLEAIDLDGDGDLDILAGGYLGRVNYLRNDAISSNPVNQNDLWMIQ